MAAFCGKLPGLPSNEVGKNVDLQTVMKVAGVTLRSAAPALDINFCFSPGQN